MKLNFLFFLPLLVWAIIPSNNLYSQPIGFIWTQSNAGDLNEEGNAVCVDFDGNIIVTGSFISPTITLGTTTLTNADISGNSQDFFLVKYDSNGNLLWAKNAGGAGHDSGQGVTTDSAGNIYAVGYFYSYYISFGPNLLINTTASLDTSDIFIVKFSPDGNVIWAKCAGSTGYDWGCSVCTNSKNNILVSGQFSGPNIVFENDTLTNCSTTGGDLFYVEYDTAGTLVRAKRAGGPSTEIGYHIAVDRNDNVLITGTFWGSPFHFGADTLITASEDTADVFVAKFDSFGNEKWARSAGGHNRDYGEGVCSDTSGNIIICGSFDSPSVTFGSATLINSLYANCFITKYDSLGNVVWANTTQNNVVSYARAVATDHANNVFATGFCAGLGVFFGLDTINSISYSHDVYVVKYDPAGNETWLRSAGGPANDFSYSIAMDNIGNPIIAGSYAGTPVNFGTATYSGTGGSDFFVSKTGNTTGISETLDAPQSVLFYPNPFSSSTTLEIKDFKNDLSVLYLFEISGREVYKKQITNSKTEIQKGNLNPGMYLYKVLSKGNLTASGKIIIQ